MKCSKCQIENSEESLFCSACGTRLNMNDIQSSTYIEDEKHQEELQTNNKHSIVKNNNPMIIKLKTILKNKKIVIPTLTACCLLLITYFVIKPPSVNEVFSKVRDYETEKATSYLDNVYPNDGGFLGLFKKQNSENKASVLSLMIKDITNEFESQSGRSISDYNAIKLEKIDIKTKDYSSDYADIDITVNNGGTVAINYIKINLYFKDKDGNILKSDWTNDNSNIQPGASQVISTMAKLDGWNYISAKIAEVR